MIDLTNMPQLIVAYDSNSVLADLIHISKAELGKDYYCPCCRNIVHARAQKSKKEQQHYYHLNQSCDQESQIHWMYKHFLFEEGGQFYINDKLYTVKNIDIEIPYNTSIGIYKPDITVYTTNNDKFFFELYFTNKKDPDYLYKWQELDIPVVEVNLKELINSEIIEIPHFDFLYKDGILYKQEYHKTNIYASTIGAYKEKIKRQDYLNYKIHWEKLDYYYQELSKYLKAEITERDLSKVFSELDLEDMYPCYENIKRTNCVKYLKDFFIEQINIKVQDIIKESIQNKNKYCNVSFKKVTDRTDYCILSVPYKEEYIDITFKLKSKLVFQSKVHNMNDINLLNETYKLSDVLIQYYNKCKETEEDLKNLYEQTNIKGYIDNVYYIEYKEGYYERNFFESILKFKTTYKWIDSQNILDIPMLNNTNYKYNFGCFGNNENIYLNTDRNPILVDSIKEWVDEAVSYEISKNYFNTVIQFIKNEHLENKIQEYVNTSLKEESHITYINYYIYKNHLDITLYIDQNPSINYSINLRDKENTAITYTKGKELCLLIEDKVKKYCDNLIIINNKIRPYVNSIKYCKGQAWSIKTDIIYSESSPYGKLIINFKDKSYRSYSVHAESINIFLEDKDKEIKNKILIAMLNLIKRAESHGLGLYNQKWWSYEKYIDEGANKII